MTWLLTGGAGYIGAHVARALLDAGRAVVVLDDLSTGAAERVPPGVALVAAPVQDADALAATLADHDVRGVIHLAAKKAVGESVERPVWYFRENVDGMLSLLEAMDRAGVDRLVLSSSAAVYGTPEGGDVDEDAPTRPESPYGRTKLACEWLAADVARARGLRHVDLRYFNVAGAGRPELGDTGVFNLIPLVLRALTTGRPPQVFGADYPTPDGTCIRDYIHVADLAEAHVAAVAALEADGPSRTYNVGRGEGASVLEVIDAVRSVTGLDVAPEVVGRRAGDPARVVARADRIRAELGWTARHDLADMVASAWEAWPARP
ncbi:MAG: UDP-glucose 4-epimerase GalE [Acidimicrobiia bacterium]